MGYQDNLTHHGLRFSISDCFGEEIGFNWKDPDFISSVNCRDERIWEILEWAVNGGAQLFDDAAVFEREVFSYPVTDRSIFKKLGSYSTDELMRFLANPNCDESSKEIIQDFFSGELESRAIEEEEEELRKPKQTTCKAKGYVYLIVTENGLYKIGKAKDIEQRLHPFGVNFPMKWNLIHSFSSEDYGVAEKLLHEKFCEKRKVGEWFELDNQDVEYITSIQDGQL